MKKGYFGFSLWLYPFIALWTVLVGPALASFLILGFVIVVEQDEWTIKQCAHAVMFNIYWNVYSFIMDWITGSLGSIPLVGAAIALPFSIIDIIVWIVLVILTLILGLGRLKNGQDIGLPGKGIVNRAYGFAQQNWGNQNQFYGQPPYGQQTPPPGQPYPNDPYQQAPSQSQPYGQQYPNQPYQQPQQGYAPPPQDAPPRQ